MACGQDTNCRVEELGGVGKFGEGLAQGLCDDSDIFDEFVEGELRDFVPGTCGFDQLDEILFLLALHLFCLVGWCWLFGVF
jgi:hypothetical protein